MKYFKSFLDYTFLEGKNMYPVNVRNMLWVLFYINIIFIIMWLFLGLPMKILGISIYYIGLGWNLFMLLSVAYGISKLKYDKNED